MKETHDYRIGLGPLALTRGQNSRVYLHLTVRKPRVSFHNIPHSHPHTTRSCLMCLTKAGRMLKASLAGGGVERGVIENQQVPAREGREGG